MRANKSSILIDLVGTATLALMGLWVAWFSFFRPDTAASQVHALSGVVKTTSTRLQELEQGLDKQKSIHRGLIERATDRDTLPDEIPIQKTLSDITSLADRHGVRLVGVSPLSEVRYTGVLEIRYKVLAEGEFQKLITFLKEFESEDYWADVTYLNLQPGKVEKDGSSVRSASLTLSFFSAIPETPADEQS